MVDGKNTEQECHETPNTAEYLRFDTKVHFARNTQFL
jgi:hypothetical protein